MFFKKKKRTPMKREVYLMERNPSVWKEIFCLRREIKIGVAKNTQQRHNHVDDGIPGKVVVLKTYLVEEATTVEAHLHVLFKAHRFTVKGAKRGSGKTEFFRLTSNQIRQAERILEQKSENDNLLIVIIIVVVLIYLISTI